MDQLIIAILAWLHIFFAIGWLGGALMFGAIIGPALASLSPTSSGEFFVKIVPKVLRFFRIVPGMTLLFGFLLLYAFTNGNFAVLSPSNSFGLKISMGMTSGLIAALTGEFIAARNFHRAVHIISQARSSGGSDGPPAGLVSTLSRARMGAMATILLLLLALVFMVGSAFYS